MHDLRGLCSEKRPSLARCSPDASSNGALQGILNTWGAYLAKISSFWIHGGDILPRKGVFPVRDSFGNALGRYFARNSPPSSARSALRGCFIQRMRLHLPEMGLEKVPSRNASLRYPKMRFEDASPRAFRLRRRKGDDYCRVQPTSVCLFGAVGLWAMRRCGASGTGCRR